MMRHGTNMSNTLQPANRAGPAALSRQPVPCRPGPCGSPTVLQHCEPTSARRQYGSTYRGSTFSVATSGPAGFLGSRSLLRGNHRRCSSHATLAAEPTPAPAAEMPTPAKITTPAVIIGAGPAGLATALLLARRGYTDIKVFERLPEPPAPDDMSVWGDFEQASERLYMIGINGRGQKLLSQLGVLGRVAANASSVSGRKDWQPNKKEPVATRYTNRSYITRCIQRDRLSSCLLQELRYKYSSQVSVEFNVDCTQAEWHATTAATSASDSKGSSAGATETRGQPAEVCRLTLVRQAAGTANPGSGPAWQLESSFVIGADGARSSIRAAMEKNASSGKGGGGRFRVARFEDRRVLVYRTIPLFWPPELGMPGDLNFSARTGSGINIDCLPTREGPYIGVVLYKPGDQRVSGLRTMQDAKDFFQKTFPMFMPALRDSDLERFAQKGDSSLPSFSYAGPVLHQGSTTCLVGDTIHTVKPYFGQGVNSAFEDVQVLGQALDECGDDVGRAVRRYSELRAKDAEALVELSRSLDGGFFTFILPLIIDSTLHRLLPAVFSPNTIASLMNEQRRFSEVRARKWLDRWMQAVLFGGLLVGLVKLVCKLVVHFGRMMGRC